MSKLINVPEGYGDFLDNLELVNIIANRADFALQDMISLPVQEYQAQINRSAGEITLSESHLILTVGFQITGIREQQQVFQSHIHYLVVFLHSNREQMEAWLDNPNLKELFCGVQADKLVWPYLRQALSQMLFNAGLPPATLPLLK